MLVAVLSAPVPANARLWQPMILQCQLIVGADSGGHGLTPGTRKLDVAIGDFDSWNGLGGAPEVVANSTIRLSVGKDDSDTDAAVNYAIQNGATEIWLFGGSGSRIDHWFSNWRLVERTSLIRRWYSAHEVLYRMGPSEQLTFPKGRLSVLPLGRGPWSVTSSGLDWELDGVDFGSRLSLSNNVPQTAVVAISQGDILIARELPGLVAAS